MASDILFRTGQEVAGFTLFTLDPEVYSLQIKFVAAFLGGGIVAQVTFVVPDHVMYSFHMLLNPVLVPRLERANGARKIFYPLMDIHNVVL